MLYLIMLGAILIASFYLIYKGYRQRNAVSQTSRQYIYGLIISIVGAPILFVVMLYLLKSPIQKGYIFSDVGPLLNFIFTPVDLFIPLAAAKLDSHQTTYTFKFKHKYVGSHQLEISYPIEKHDFSEIDLTLHVQISDGNKILLDKTSKSTSGFMGQREGGRDIIYYNVPRDLPVRKKLTAVVTIQGALDKFTQKYGPATISFRHGSDE